jgi:DNA processing protein
LGWTSIRRVIRAGAKPLDASATRELDRDALRVALLPGIGPRTRQALLDTFGTSARILAASAAELERVPGVGRKLSRRICEEGPRVDVDSLLATCDEHQMAVVLAEDPRYPAMLREIPDPPGVLFLWGSLPASDRIAMAIVGTRHATHYGTRQAERLSVELVRAGFTVVSGLARGIDAAAHRGCLQAGGRTLAVLGGGFLRLYPPEHTELAQQIRQQGCLISESPPQSPPCSGNFPQRNRVITGMSLGVIVIEAGHRSGALISARHALEQGREVFALPGRVDSPVSRGCHELLRDGAKLVESVDDVLEELDALVHCAASARQAESALPAGKGDDGFELFELPTLGPEEQRIWDAIGEGRVTVDQVVMISKMPIQQVLATISRLELRHLVQRTGGAWVERRRKRRDRK